jgi:hypothetical protein
VDITTDGATLLLIAMIIIIAATLIVGRAKRDEFEDLRRREEAQRGLERISQLSVSKPKAKADK